MYTIIVYYYVILFESILDPFSPCNFVIREGKLQNETFLYEKMGIQEHFRINKIGLKCHIT